MNAAQPVEAGTIPPSASTCAAAGSARFPYPPLDALSPAKRQRAFGAGQRRLLNVSRMAMHASDGLWSAQAALGRATIEADIGSRLRELVILRVAYLDRSDYELFHHRGLARAAGITEAEVAAVSGGDPFVLDEGDRTVLDFVDGVVREATPADAIVDAMRRLFGDTLVFDLVILIGSYMMTARIAAVGGVPLDDQPVAGW